MTVFVTYAPADQAAAEELENFIERRGQFAQLDDGQAAQRPVTGADVVVLLLSAHFLAAPTRLRLEQRALDAWAEGRLVLVKLDDAAAPVGLADLASIAAPEAAREAGWAEVSDRVGVLLRQAPAPADAPAGRRRGSSVLWAFGLSLMALPGLLALAALAAIWLVNRIGPAPGGWAELMGGIEAFGLRYGVPTSITPWLFALALALTLGAGLAALARRAARAPRRAAAAPALYVSYARANAPLAQPLVAAAWAGAFTRSIGEAAAVMVLCSKAAFESDEVKRAIFLADRARKRLLPVFIEAAEPPEDFEYFFAGVQSVNLFETPESDRAAVLARALGAPT